MAADMLDRASVSDMISSVLRQIEGGRLDQAVAELRAYQMALECTAPSPRALPARSQSTGGVSEAEDKPKAPPTVPKRVRAGTGAAAEGEKPRPAKRSPFDGVMDDSALQAAKKQIASGNSLAMSCDVGQLVRKGKAAREKEKKEERKKRKKLKSSKKRGSPEDFSLSGPVPVDGDARPAAPSRSISSPLNRDQVLAMSGRKQSTPQPSTDSGTVTTKAEQKTTAEQTTAAELVSPRRTEPVERSEKQQKQYSHVVRELFDTERGYIRDLDTIIEHFKVPLEQQGLITAAQSAVMFSNIEMLRQVNTELLRQLEDITRNEDEAKAAAQAEGDAAGMTQEELDQLKQITGMMTVTVVDSAGFQFDKRLPIDASVTFGKARELLVNKLAPLVAGGATAYENYRLHTNTTPSERVNAHARVLESVGFKRTELNFLFKRDTSSSVSVGGALLNMAEYLKAYTEYCSNQLDSMGLAAKLEKKDKDVKAFFRKALRDKRCRQLDLNAFLIMPLQRVCKYPLLIRELIGATPDGHDEKANLEKAAKLIGATVRTINDSKKEREGLKIMREINEATDAPKNFKILVPSRRYASQGKAAYLPPKAKEPIPAKYFFFNDIILVNTMHDEDGVMKYLKHIEVKNAFVNPKGVPGVPHSVTVSRPGKNADAIALVAKNEREHKKLTDAVQQHVMRDAYHDWVLARQRAGATVEPYEVWFKTYGKMFMQ